MLLVSVVAVVNCLGLLDGCRMAELSVWLEEGSHSNHIVQEDIIG